MKNHPYGEGVRVSLLSMLMNTFLFILKLGVGLLASSQGLIADAIHSLSDVASTLLVLVGLKVASKKPDRDHPYGHERFEAVFAKILALFLGLTGLGLVWRAGQSLWTGQLDRPGSLALWAALASILVKEAMYQVTKATAQKIGSISMEADAWHHRSDAFSSIGTFIGVLGSRFGYLFFDPLAGLVVGLMIIQVALKIYRSSIDSLVDKAADLETIKKIKNIVRSVPGVLRIADLKTRTFASYIYVDINIEVDGQLTVRQGHDIATQVHDQVEGLLKDVKHIMVHVEPDGAGPRGLEAPLGQPQTPEKKEG